MALLVRAFVERGKDVDGPLSMLMGMMPLLKMYMSRIEAQPLTDICQYLGTALHMIADPDVTESQYSEFLEGSADATSQG